MLDVVRLTDGREGTIVDSFDGGKALMIEIVDGSGATVDTPIVDSTRVERILYTA